MSAEAVFLSNTSDASKSELEYLSSAVQDSDTAALVHITSIAKSYRATAAGLAALPVPQELAADDLAVINALMRM